MSVDTAATCTTAQRSCRSKVKVKRGKVRRDPTSPLELSDVKAPQIHINDDLGLQLLEVGEIPQDMLFPGEYNVYLQDKLQSACEENKQLSILHTEREQEITVLKDKMHTLEQKIGDSGMHVATNLLGQDSIRHADMAACRVMELSKQVCELTVQLEEQKSRCAIAESKLLSYLECQEERRPVSSEILSKKDSEIKTLSDKLHTTNSKLFECRNKVQHLQQELKNAQKVLSHEVGDGVLVCDLVSSGTSNGGWRGRAQQIQILQQRNAELTERLRRYCELKTFESLPNYCGEGRSTVKERKASLEVAQQETRVVQQQLSENTRKLEAAKARIKVLELEASSSRGCLQMLTDKANRDDEFIQILQGQLSQLESALQLSKDDARVEHKNSEKYYQQLADDQRIEKQRSMQLLSNLEEKEKQIKRLEDIVFDLKDREIDSLRREHKVDKEMAEVPTIRSDVLPDNNNSVAKVSPTEQECKKLIELVGTANRRLNDARHECDKHKSALRIERQRLARLEAKLARLEMERISPFSMSKRYMVPNSKKAAANSIEATQSTENLNDKLELLHEEVLTLKTRLSCLEHEKEDDLRVFAGILNGTSRQTLPITLTDSAVESSKTTP